MKAENPLIVVKVGGSLFDLPGLGVKLAAFLNSLKLVEDRSPARILVIVGGGEAVDFVRQLDEIHHLGDSPAHQLALRGMDLSAHALAMLLGGALVVERLTDLERIWEQGETPILAPRIVLEKVDESSEQPLPHSWDVTSDSIAARIAALLGADRLILLKSANVRISCLREAVRIGLVDPVFPVASASLPRVEYVGFRGGDGILQTLN